MRIATRVYELEPYVKLKSVFEVTVHEGIFADTNEFRMNKHILFRFKVSHRTVIGYINFTIDDKPYKLCYDYSVWTGKPTSYILLQDDRILAQYGKDSALKASQEIQSF